MSKSPTPELILKRLEWTVLRRLDGLLHGDYRTLFRGFGLDLADLREYQYHDDVRHIDWNVTARLQTPYVREFNEEREVAAWFLLDLSPSVDFGSASVKKQSVATDFVTVLARMLTRHGNRVGAMFYGANVDTVIPARSGRRHVLHIMQRMLNRPRLALAPATNLNELLRTGFDVMRRRSVVFVVSDFISAPGWGRMLAHLAQRHEVVAVRLRDPRETALPDVGIVAFEDPETGDQLLVDTGDRRLRERFTHAGAAQDERSRADLARRGVDQLVLSTAEDLMPALVRFLGARKHRRGRAGGVTRMHRVG
jgi:uncharacterized protein (DUF58 family)